LDLQTLDQNYEILRNLELFQMLDLPLLLGFLKSMIYKVLDSSAKEALNGTTFLNGFALSKGASILRVTT
jgi:dihydropteroate synthase